MTKPEEQITLARQQRLQEHIDILRKALEAARDHLEYCGYGDRYEREARTELAPMIEDALEKTKPKGK